MTTLKQRINVLEQQRDIAGKYAWKKDMRSGELSSLYHQYTNTRETWKNVNVKYKAYKHAAEQGRDGATAYAATQRAISADQRRDRRREAVQEAAGLTDSEYKALLPSAKDKLYRAYAGGSLSNTRAATQTPKPAPAASRGRVVLDERGKEYVRQRNRDAFQYGTARAGDLVGPDGLVITTRANDGTQTFAEPETTITQRQSEKKTGGWSLPFGTAGGMLAIERAAGVPTFDVQGWDQTSVVSGNLLYGSGERRDYEYTVTPKTPAAAYYLNTRENPQGGPGTRLRTTTYAYSGSYSTPGEFRINTVLKAADEKVTSNPFARYAPPLGLAYTERLGSEMQDRGKVGPARYIGYTVKRASQRPVTAALVGLASTTPAGRLLVGGLVASSLVTGYREDQRQEYSSFYNNPAFNQATYNTPYKGVAPSIFNPPSLIPQKGWLTYAKDVFTQQGYRSNVRDNLFSAGFRGDQLDKATDAAAYAKRTQEYSFAVGTVVAGEGMGNVWGSVGRKLAAGPLKRYVSDKGLRTGLSFAYGGIVGGYGEGFVASAAYDLSRKERFDPKKAFYSGLLGSATAGLFGRWYGSKVAVNRGGQAEIVGNILDVPEYPGDITTSLAYGQNPFSKTARGRIYTSSFNKAGAIDISFSEVRTKNPVKARTRAQGYNNLGAFNFGSTLPSRNIGQGLNIAPVRTPAKTRTRVPGFSTTNFPSFSASPSTSITPSFTGLSTFNFDNAFSSATTNTAVPAFTKVDVPAKTFTPKIPFFFPGGPGGRRGSKRAGGLGKRGFAITPTLFEIDQGLLGKKGVRKKPKKRAAKKRGRRK